MAVHRTARGNAVDMSTLMAKNEKTRAVGNMNVNARGDVIDNHNKIIKDNTKKVKSGYQKLVAPQAQKATVPDRKPAIPPAPVVEEVTQPLEENDLSVEEQELFEDDEDIEK